MVSVASADFVDDEFQQANLGVQWSFSGGSSEVAGALGESYPVTPGGHLSLIPAVGSGFSWDLHGDTNISQDQPGDGTWDVRLKLDGWNPGPAGPSWQQVGLRLYESEDRWLGLNVTRRPTMVVLQAQSQFTDVGAGETPLIHKTEIPVFSFGLGASLYLRIQKTSKGYGLAYSLDGVAWVDRGVFVRNPFSVDGFMDPGARIRISVIAPNNDGNGFAGMAMLDWIRKLPLLANAAGYGDDEFDGLALDSRWLYFEGIHNLPGVPGGMALGDGKVRLKHSTGYDVEAGFNRDKAQFIMQDAPVGGDFSLVTKVGPADLRGYGMSEGHGIRLWQDQNHWIAVTNQRDEGLGGSARNQVNFRYEFGNGGDTGGHAITLGGSSAVPGPEYLRLDKEGAKYRARYSFDGVTWLVAADSAVNPGGWVNFGTELRNAQVQLFGKRPTATGSGAAVSEFDYIRQVPGADGVE